MKTLRRLAYVALGIAFAHIVFGAIVRITGSGLGCGDHWPKCHGYWVPPFTRPDLVIEVMHRYLALTLSLAVLALAVAALRRRREPGVGGPAGVLRPAAAAGVLVVAAALFGALTVKLELTNKYVIVVHLALAIATIASIALAAMRAGGLGAALAMPGTGSAKASRGAVIAAGLAFVAVVLGGLTAHVVGANTACIGFPHCPRAMAPSGPPLWLHLAHRTVAFLLLGHLVGLVIGVSKRKESAVLLWASRIAFGTVVLQILVAAALVEMHLPPVLKSLHQAIGTLVWLSLFVFAVLARRASGDAQGATLPPLAPRVVPGEGVARGTVATAGVASTLAHPGETSAAVTAALDATPVVATASVAEPVEAPPAVEEAAEEAPSGEPIAIAIEPEVWAAMSGASAAAFGAGSSSAHESVSPEPTRDAAEDARAAAAPAEPAPAVEPEPSNDAAAADDAEEPTLSLDDEVAAALEALMATSAVVDLDADDDEEDAEEFDREDALAALQADFAARAAAAEREEREERDAATEEVSAIPADVAQLPPRRPPTLAVLIARGADF